MRFFLSMSPDFYHCEYIFFIEKNYSGRSGSVQEREIKQKAMEFQWELEKKKLS